MAFSTNALKIQSVPQRQYHNEEIVPVLTDSVVVLTLHVKYNYSGNRKLQLDGLNYHRIAWHVNNVKLI